MAQPGYENHWGRSGRDDFGVIKRMGANTIRLYHPIGQEDFFKAPQPSHRELLDAAHYNGLKVFGAVHQYLHCTEEDDCYESWFKAVDEGLKQGFAYGSKWHPSVWALNMINEVDAAVPFNDGGRQVKRLISAIDGLLAAEKLNGVQGGGVNLTSCFTTAIAEPLGPGPKSIYHGFSSMENWIRNSSLVQYVPRSRASPQDLANEVNKRWIHCINAQIPWKNGLDNMVANKYAAEFFPRPWILGEMGWNGVHQDVIVEELQMMHDFALAGSGFAGTFFFQFQTAYQKPGSELNYGMFGLGNKTLGQTVHPKDPVSGESHNYPIHCLTSRLYAFEQPWSQCKEECNHRAQAVARAFKGTISGNGLCLNDVPLVPKPPPALPLLV